MDITALLKLMVAKGISDIHFKADSPPAVRVHGKLIPATNLQKLSSADIQGMAAQIMTPEQMKHFQAENEVDVAYSLAGISRFRINIFQQRGTVSLSLRVIPLKVRSFDDLNLPKEALEKLSGESRGLILFVGVTGAGKTRRSTASCTTSTRAANTASSPSRTPSSTTTRTSSPPWSSARWARIRGPSRGRSSMSCVRTRT